MDRDYLESSQDFEQASQLLVDKMPYCWHQIYVNLIHAGFSEERAERVLMAFVHGYAGGKLVNN
jgi:hypothetical protein